MCTFLLSYRAGESPAPWDAGLARQLGFRVALLGESIMCCRLTRELGPQKAAEGSGLAQVRFLFLGWVGWGVYG